MKIYIRQDSRCLPRSSWRSLTAAKKWSKLYEGCYVLSIWPVDRTPRTPWGRTQDQAGIYSWWGKQKQPRSQAVNVCIQLQKVQKFRGLFRSHDEPSMFSAGCCSSAHVEFRKFLYPTLQEWPVHQYLCAAAQGSDDVILDPDPPLISKKLELPRCQGDQGSNVPCIAGGCVLTISDDDHGEIQRQHLSSFCTHYCYFILLVLASNQSCLTRLTIGSKD